jgi:hypothetical protein
MLSPSRYIVLKTVYKVHVDDLHDDDFVMLSSDKLCKKLTSLLNSRKHKQIYRQIMSAEYNNQVGAYWPDFGRAKASTRIARNGLIHIEFVMPLCVLLPAKPEPMMPLEDMFTEVRDELVRRDYAAGHLARIGFTQFEIMPEPHLWKMAVHKA